LDNASCPNDSSIQFSSHPHSDRPHSDGEVCSYVPVNVASGCNDAENSDNVASNFNDAENAKLPSGYEQGFISFEDNLLPCLLNFANQQGFTIGRDSHRMDKIRTMEIFHQENVVQRVYFYCTSEENCPF